MQKKKILVVYATSRDKAQLNTHKFLKQYQFYFHDYDITLLEKILCRCVNETIELASPAEELKNLIEFAQTNAIDAIISTDDYPACIYASALSNHIGLPGPLLKSILFCQHKYYSRIIQQRSVPRATPNFALICPKNDRHQLNGLNFPFFIKPVKSNFSIYASKVSNDHEFQQAINQSLPPASYLENLNWFLALHEDFEIDANYLLAEEFLEGYQVTLDGFVYDNNIEIFGIVDSIMFPGTICFERFDYPSSLSFSIQERMKKIASDCIKGLNLNNSLFNIEFMYNPEKDTIHIIEVNPRMSSQFADLYEKVDNFNLYQILIDIALNQKPQITKNQGPFKMASSFVFRLFEDKIAKVVPDAEHINNIKKTFNDAHIEIYVKNNEKLSSFKQDGKSFRYGLINLGADSKEELFEKYQFCNRHLPFEFQSV